MYPEKRTRQKTYHRSQNSDTRSKGHDSENELQLGEALAKDIKCLAGCGSGTVNIASVSEDKTGTFQQGRAREHGLDASDIACVGEVPFPIEVKVGRVAEQAFFGLSRGGVTVDRAAGVKDGARNANDGVGGGESAE